MNDDTLDAQFSWASTTRTCRTLISEEKLIVKLLLSLIQKKYRVNLVVTSVRETLKEKLILKFSLVSNTRKNPGFYTS